MFLFLFCSFVCLFVLGVFFLLFSFVGKLDVVFFPPKLGDRPFLASFGLLAIFPLNMFVFVCIFNMFCGNKIKIKIKTCLTTGFWLCRRKICSRTKLTTSLVYIDGFSSPILYQLKGHHLKKNTNFYSCTMFIGTRYIYKAVIRIHCSMGIWW